MLKRVLCALILSLVLVLPLVSASVQINVKTYPNHKVFVSVLDSEQLFSLLESYQAMSDSEGKVSVTFAGAQKEIKLIIKVTENGEKIALENFGNDQFSTSSPIYVLVTPEESSADYEDEWSPVTEVANETAENATGASGEASSIEESNSSSGGMITGLVSSAKEIVTSKKTYYILGSAIAAVLLLFLFFRVGMPAIKGWKASSSFSSPKPSYAFSNQMIENAERKIREAQAEINRFKNQNRITLAEKKLAQDKEDLEKLRKVIN